ncbi:MAG: sigma-70 family RNA polymerase sigma factor [Gemmatimonadaceae bacterium]|nr:sigma-70 family RNA polymerase sigma factor [Gloeobacterales cyanobacterium ES-bin-141]
MAEDLNQSDAQLTQAVRQSDSRALALIYDRYGAVVYRLGLRILQDPREAEDLTQEIFLFFWNRGKDNYDPQRGTLNSYLMTMTRSRALDRIRRQETAWRTQQRWKAEMLTAPARLPLETVSLGERSERVRGALGQLPEAQRTVLEMAYFEGYSQTEIAQQLQEPLGTVKTRSRLGLLKLKQALSDLIP